MAGQEHRGRLSAKSQGRVNFLTLSLHQQLADVVDSNAILPQERLSEYAVDGVIPQAAVEAPDRQSIAELLSWASDRRFPVFPRGGGAQMNLGNVPEEVGLALATSCQSRILDYEPADLTATVEAGITLDRLQQQLSVGGQFLPLESPLAERSTIGGLLAANATGALRHSYGQPRDWLIGIAVVGAGGQETKAGGRVVKNVTGYDLNKLYTGSLGTLGIIVEATFKLAPAPPERGTLVAAFPTIDGALSAGTALLQQICTPQGVQVLDRQASRRLSGMLGGAVLPCTGTGEAQVIALFSGRPRALKRRLEECTRILRESGASEISPLDENDGAQLVKSLNDLGWGEGDKPDLTIKLNLPPASLARAITGLRQESPAGTPPAVIADPGFGVVRLFWWSEAVLEGPHGIDDSQVLHTIAEAQDAAKREGGSALVEFCPLPLKKQIDVWGPHPQGLEVMRRIKQNFDPLGILSPGRFVGGL